MHISRVFSSVPINPNLPKVTITTEPRKYSKYNGYVVAETKTILRYLLLQSFYPDCHAEVYIWQRRLRTFLLSLSLFFFEHFHLRIFFSCSHSKLEMLKISGRKRNIYIYISVFLFFSLFLFLKTRGDWKRSRERKISKKRNPRGHIRITFKPRFTPLRRFSSSR